MEKKNVWTVTGRRKQSVAKVTMKPGKGNIIVNGKKVEDYMPYATLVLDLKQPLTVTNTLENFDFDIKVVGGGFSGQTGAIRLGIARVLMVYEGKSEDENSYAKILKVNGFRTRDARIKERKKYGLKKARRAPQFSKR